MLAQLDSLEINVWRFNASLALGLAAAVVAYTAGVVRMRRLGLWGTEIRSRHVACFAAGLLTLAVALMTPIDYIGETYLFWVHMVQHILIAMIAPPLILLGLPRWMVQAALDALRIGPVVKAVTHPVVAYIAFNVSLVAWHLPALYETALHDPLVHILEHTFFLVTGLLSWYPVIDPAGQHAGFHPLAKIVYLLLFVFPSGVLGAAFAFAAEPIYATYAQAPRLWGLSPLEDQAIAGGVMWVPGWAIYFVALSIVFALWMRAEERAGESSV